jgi:probable DNA repair protein
MLAPLINISLFREFIEGDRLILTPNHRLAAKITDAWAIANRDDRRVWQAPRVFSIDHWLRFCWDELQDQNHDLVAGLGIVGQQQSRYYWERAIKLNHPELSSKYAKLADDTLSRLQQWNLAYPDVPSDSPAADYFKQWAQSFDGLLHRNNLVTTAQSWHSIARGFEAGALPIEDEVVLYGFQSIPPIQSNIINEASRQCTTIKTPISQTQASVLNVASPAEELRLAAHWAAQQLKINKDERIGIIIPDLKDNLAAVARVVAEACQTEKINPVVNISAGISLSATAIVSQALDLIGMLKQQYPLEAWITILYSPHSLFDRLPISFRVDAENRLRAASRFTYDLREFLNEVMPNSSEDNSEHTDLILRPLITTRDSRAVTEVTKQDYSSWALMFKSVLNDLGWPGSRGLDSAEYQQRAHWDRLLEEFSELDNLLIEVGFNSALKQLRLLAQDAVFHPQTADAPLQILGLLEGDGLRFDQLWITGMHSQNFPASVAINSLLPASFQRLHAMPHSLPERELEIAQSLLQGFKNNTGRLLLSYPELKGEEQMEPSPLLRLDPRVNSEVIAGDVTQHPRWLTPAHQYEVFKDSAPPYDPDKETIRTGSTLLKNQSLCPFNAFAVHRLKAEPLEEPSQGLSAKDRGSLLHDILFRLWRQWDNSSSLYNLTSAALHEILTETINETLHEFIPRHSILRGNRYRALEQTRLEKLLLAWLELEKQRPPFSVIDLECSQRLRFGDLEISLKLDRIDSVDGDLVVIDYKSGEVTASHWQGDRPKDPQLPLYVLASEPQAKGCAFAQVKAGKIKFTGISESELIADVKPLDSWDAQVSQWQSAIKGLADEFTSGVAQVEVFDTGSFQYQTHLLPLNRWHEESDINTELLNKSNQ